MSFKLNRATLKPLLWWHIFQLYLTLHSYGQFILIPWGYDYKYQYPADYSDMLALGKKAASKFRSYNYQVNNTVALLSPGAGQ